MRGALCPPPVITNKEDKKNSFENNTKASTKGGSFFSKGSNTLQMDPKPIINEGAPISTEDLFNAAILCDFLVLQLKLDKPH